MVHIMTTLSEFERELTEPLKRRVLSLRRGYSGARYSRHLLELKTSPKPTVLYVKESNVQPGWWGLTDSHIKGLEKAGERWFAVLLLSNTSGYVLTGGQVRLRIHDGTFKRTKGDYKVNERSHLKKPAQWFQTLEEFLDRIL
jgi:hypothetical protein